MGVTKNVGNMVVGQSQLIFHAVVLVILVAIILVETTEGTYPDLSIFVFADTHHLLVGDMIRQDEVLLG